jgi:hypothetical protein
MFVRLARLLVVLMLATTLGMHWALLQTFAWTTMLADNLRSGSLTEAVVKTFDGKHPCCLCKAVKEGRDSEHKKEFTFSVFNPEFPPFLEEQKVIAPTRFQLYPRQNFFAQSLTQQPLTPPPRGCFA